MSDDKQKQTETNPNAADTDTSKEKILDRDRSGPVSVSTEDDGKPSYTHNAEKSEPIDPHLLEDSPPGKTSGNSDDDDALERDKSSPVSVSTEDDGKPSYTHND